MESSVSGNPAAAHPGRGSLGTGCATPVSLKDGWVACKTTRDGVAQSPCPKTDTDTHTVWHTQGTDTTTTARVAAVLRFEEAVGQCRGHFCLLAPPRSAPRPLCLLSLTRMARSALSSSSQVDEKLVRNQVLARTPLRSFRGHAARHQQLAGYVSLLRFGCGLGCAIFSSFLATCRLSLVAMRRSMFERPQARSARATA